MNKSKEKRAQEDRLVSTIVNLPQKQPIKTAEHPHICRQVQPKQPKERESPQKTQKDLQKATITSIQSSEQKVKRDLADMIEEYKKEAEKMMLNHGWDPEKQANIKAHLRRLKKEKAERRAKFEEDLRRLEEKTKTLDHSSVQNSQEKLQKRASIEKRIAKIKQRENKRQEQYKKFMKFYQEFKAQKPKYALVQQQYKEKQQKENQEKIKKHKEKLDELYKPMDLKSLEDFQEEYMNKKYYAQKQRLQHQLMEKKQFETNKQKLDQLYKGHCHSLVLDQLAEQNQKINEAREKYKRIREYSRIVKEQFKPRAKSGMDGDLEESSIDSSQMPQTERGRRVVKDRYLKGQYLGKMVTYEKQPLSHQEQVSKGLKYLEYLRSLPKRTKKDEKTEPIPPIKTKSSGVYKVPRIQNPLYRGSRRYNSIDIDVKNSDSDNVRRVLQFMRHRQQQLKQDEKLLRNGAFRCRSEWQAQQKQFNSQLITNIEEKLQILKRL